MKYYLVQLEYGYSNKELFTDHIWFILHDKELDKLIELQNFDIKHRERVFYIQLKTYVVMSGEESVCRRMSKDLNRGDLQPLILSKIK